MQKRYIGIEAGGTKFICAHGTNPTDMTDRIVIPTGNPGETMPLVLEYINSVRKQYTIDAMGLAVFGPADLNAASKTFGYITTTPKIAWQHFDILGLLRRTTSLPVGIDLDVNASALGEQKWGAATNLSDFLYMTVGTGIGVGAIVNKQLLHGLSHPSMGHIIVRHDRENDPYAGSCPYHKDCLEGLASGFAMCERWQVSHAGELDEKHKAWALEVEYLSQAVIDYTNCFSPQRLIMGGGVMKHAQLIKRISVGLLEYFRDFKTYPLKKDIDSYLVKPKLGDNSGFLGAFILAEHSLTNL